MREIDLSPETLAILKEVLKETQKFVPLPPDFPCMFDFVTEKIAMINEIEHLRRINSLLEDTVLLLKERERERKN